jgi:hypothetical protein
MSLDGLRAWIGEVERKLGMRTRVFLVLAVIAIGGAGAAVYLAIDTRENAVSESDVQALQEKLEARIAAGAAGLGGLEAEPEGASPEGEAAPGADGGAGTKSGGGEEAGGGAAPGESGGGGNSGGGSGEGASGGNGGSGGEAQNGAADANKGSGKKGGSSSRLQELLEQTKEANEKAEREAGEKK